MSKTTRILTFDGTQPTGGTGWVAASLLRALRDEHLMAPEKRTHFLDNVDVFAGTSAGAANAFFFAMSKDADAALDYIIPFWKQALELEARTGTGLLRMVAALGGLSAVISTDKLLGLYTNYFGVMRLGDLLPRRVAITAFQLDTPSATNRSWQPKVFHNFDGSEDMDELVVDVLMRSGSPPIMTPIYQSIAGKGPGYCDGGVWANNPSYVALSQVLAERGGPDVEGISMLSVGNGRAPTYLDPCFRKGFANWGYWPWLINRHRLGAIVDILLDTDELANHRHSQVILQSQYCRLNPPLRKPIMAFTNSGIRDAIQEILGFSETQQQLSDTAQWLDAVNWFEEKS